MKILNVLLAAVLLGTVAANALIERADPGRPGPDFLPEMMYPVAAESFGNGTGFRDGRVLQGPPPGAIPRGASLTAYAPTPAGAVRAAAELANPLPAAGAADRGAAVYATFCVPCHGAGGLGDGPVVSRGYPPPPSLLAANALAMKDGQMFHILTYGQRNMPSYASQIDALDRWRAVAYVRQLQRSARR